jgi:hypothetical protein
MAKSLEWTTDVAEKAGESIGIAWDTVDFTPEDLLVGMNVELEHCSDEQTNVIGCDPDATARIAWAHLKESPAYYRVLAKMEQSFKKAEVRIAAGEETFDAPAQIDAKQVYPSTPSTSKSVSKPKEPLIQRAEEILSAQGKTETTWTQDEYAAAYQQAKQELLKSWSVPEKVTRDIEQSKPKATSKPVEPPSPAQQRVLDSLKTKGVATPTKRQFADEARALKKLAPKEPKPKKVKVKSVKEEALALLKARKIDEPTPEEWLAAQKEVKDARKEKGKQKDTDWISKATQDIEAEDTFTKSLDAELDPDEARGLQSARGTADKLLPALLSKLAALAKTPKAKTWFPHPSVPYQVCTVLDVPVPKSDSKYARNVAELLNIPVGAVLLATTPVDQQSQHGTFFDKLESQFDSADYSGFLDVVSDTLSASKELKTFNLKSIPWELELYDSTDNVMNAGETALPDAPAGLSVLAVANSDDIKYMTQTPISSARIPRTVLNPGKWPEFATNAERWYDVSDFTGEPSKAVIMSVPVPYQEHGKDTEVVYSTAASRFLGFSKDERETFVNYHLLQPGDAKYDEAEEAVDAHMESINDKFTAKLEDQGYHDWTAVVIDSTKDKRVPGLPPGLVILGIVPDEVLDQYKSVIEQRKFITDHAIREGAKVRKSKGGKAARGTDVDKIVKANQAELGLDDDEIKLWRQYFNYGLAATKPISAPFEEKPPKFTTDISDLPAPEREASVKTSTVKECRKDDKEPGKPICLYDKEGEDVLGHHKTEQDAYGQEYAIKKSKERNAYFKVNPLHFATQAEIQDYYSPDFLREVYGFYDETQANQAQAKVTAIWSMRKAAVGASLTYVKQLDNEIEFIGNVDSSREYRGTARISPEGIAITQLTPFAEYGASRRDQDSIELTKALGARTAQTITKGKDMPRQLKASVILKLAQLLESDSGSADDAIKAAGDAWLREAMAKRKPRTAMDLAPRMEMSDEFDTLATVIGAMQDSKELVGKIEALNLAFSQHKDEMGFKLWGVLKPELQKIVSGMAKDAEFSEAYAAYMGKLSDAINTTDAKVKAHATAAAQDKTAAAVAPKTALFAPAPEELPVLDRIMGKLDALEATIADLSATPTEGADILLYNISAALTRVLTSSNVKFDMRYATVKEVHDDKA